MDWQSPASHPLHMAQALSELIKRHFFTSPDAREKRRRKEGEKKRARRGHTALSLLWSFGEWGHFTIPSPFSFFISSTAKKKKGKKKRKEKQHFPSHLAKLFLPYQKQLSSGEECACRITTIPGGERGLHKSDWLPGSQDPLEVVMKSVTLASQLYVSIHNPSPKTSP